MARIITCICIFSLFISVFGSSPKREVRASWMATVWGLDWPTTTSTAASASGIQQQKKELITILDSLKRAHMNAVFFQVRGMCDAMYESSYEPWSQYVSGARGVYPGYDPLQFAIEEAHKRGLELHAWVNPYRYSSAPNNHGTLPQDYSQTHPEWLLTYPMDSEGRQTVILNPGLPEVIQQIKSVIGELIDKYDLDGILFDDYFYAYGGTPNDLDKEAQERYKPKEMTIGDWRRQNVNKMIAGVYDTIQQKKPYLRFGVSPFGTWTNDRNIAAERGIELPEGVGVTMDAYTSIYCDPIAWLEERSVDFISPQIYWTTDSSYPYGILSKWWAGISGKFGRHFYASQELSGLSVSSSVRISKAIDAEITLQALSTLEKSIYYSLNTDSELRASTAFAPSEIGTQIDFNRIGDVNDAPGNVFYKTSNLVKTKGFIDYLRREKFVNPALLPEMSWKHIPGQTQVKNISLIDQTLSWEYLGNNVKYAVYAVPIQDRTKEGILASSTYLQGITYSLSFTLPDSVHASSHAVFVSIVDRYGKEYIPQEMSQGTTTISSAQLKYPVDGQTNLVMPFSFEWEPDIDVDIYILQVSSDEAFSTVLYSREVSTPYLSSVKFINLKEGVPYYWRVVSRRANAKDSYSEARTFSVNRYFKIISPEDGSSNHSLTPSFQWDNIGANVSYRLEISKDASFSYSRIVYSISTNLLTQTVPPEKLMYSNTYYARVIAVDGFLEVISPVITFATKSEYIPIPEITSPKTGDIIVGDRIDVCWKNQASKGFRVEISQSESFPPRSTTVKSTNAFTYCSSYEGLPSGEYYLRVKANNEKGFTDPSDVIKVSYTASNSSLNHFVLSNLNCVFYHQNTSAYLNIVSEGQDFASIHVYTASGLLLDQYTVELNTGDNLVVMNNYPGGLYLIKIQTSQHKKVIKANY